MRLRNSFFVGLIALALICLSSFNAQAKDIKVGGIWGFTGAVSTVQTILHQGFEDYIKWVNDHGGVKGNKIAYSAVDSGYTVRGYLNQYWKLADSECKLIYSIDSQAGMQ